MLRLPARHLSALLASLGLAGLSAGAQPQVPEPPGRDEREVVLTGGPDERPVVYGAPDVPLVLLFDGPLRKGEGVAVPGADVHPHPLLGNTLVLTASKSLAAQGSVPLSVPLADGVVALRVVFSREKVDGRVRIVRRPASTGGTVPRMVRHEELQEALRISASAVFGRPESLPLVGPLNTQPRTVIQNPQISDVVLVRVVGSFTYLRVETEVNSNRGCLPTQARLVLGQETVEVLVSEPAVSCLKGKSCQMLIVRTPLIEADGLLLELLAEDGSRCGNIQGVKLSAGAP